MGRLAQTLGVILHPLSTSKTQMRIASSIALLTILLVTACSTPGSLPTKATIERTRTFDAPFEVVWPAIIGGIAETNLKITTLEKASGLIAIADTQYSKDDATEGTRGSVLGVADLVMNRSASLNIFAVSAGGDRTSVRVNVGMKMNIRTGNGSMAFPFVYSWEESFSNGSIEGLILDGIAKRIQK